MNKSEFLELLRKKIAILNDDEKNDIINEYEDAIEEKIKHGKSEDEALKEFGDIDELAKDILSAYKINPEFNKKKSANDFFNKCEKNIKKFSNKVADFIERFVDGMRNNGNDFTVASIFEFVFKIILILLGLAILKIPFIMVSEIGQSIFESYSSYHVGEIASTIWAILLEVSYFGICILLIISFISKYAKKDKNENYVEEKKDDDTSNRKNTDKKIQKENTKNNNNGSLFSFLFTLILKIFVVIVFLMPMVFCDLGILCGIIGCLILIFKGIFVFGFLITGIAAFVFVGSLIYILYNGLFSSNKINFYPLLGSIVLGSIGIMLSVYYILGFTYYNDVPESIERKRTDSVYI